MNDVYRRSTLIRYSQRAFRTVRFDICLHGFDEEVVSPRHPQIAAINSCNELRQYPRMTKRLTKVLGVCTRRILGAHMSIAWRST